QGAFSYVYLAEHIYLKMHVALKIMRVRLPEQERVNFLKEAEIIGQLVHPHIVPAYDCGVEGEVFYLAMAYAANGSMRKRYPKRSCLAPFEVVQYVHQAAEALQYAHNQNIIHCDIKPENMLLGPEGELWLSDFGLSLELPSSHSLSLQEIAGTLYYMAPEQAQGKPHFASDQYSLAAVAYEWLCGCRPFEGSYTEVLSQLLGSPVPRPRTLNATISPAIEGVVLKALAKNPDERFASVQAFAQALDAASNESPTVLPLQSAEDPEESIQTHVSDLQGSPTIPPSQVPPVSVPSMQTFPAQVLPDPPIPAPPVQVPLMPTAPMQTSPAQIPLALPPYAPQAVPHASPSRRPSRRTVVGTLLGFAVVIGTGIAAFELRPRGKSGAQLLPTPQSTPRVRPTPSPPGTILFTYTKHVDEVKSVAWSPDSRRIASAAADSDETVQVWDALNGGNELTYPGHKQEKLPPSLKKNPVKVALWSPDGAYIASGDEVGKVRVWYAKTGRDLPASPYSGHEKPVRTLAWSHGGRFIASGGEDTQVQLWNAQTSQRELSFTLHKSPVFGVAWSRDDRYIASASGDKNPLLTTGDNTVYVWNAANGQVVTTYTGHNRTVRSVAWSPQTASNLIASASEDGTIQVWNALTGKFSISYNVPTSSNVPVNGVEAIAWSPDGHMIAAACGGLPIVVVWKVADGEPVVFYTGHKKGLWSVAWSPDGRLIVSGSMDHSAQVWTAPQSQ
ncbi:MAG TPA: protein kinase, partial [Ktedonobacteraceae bacterium]|nr:protein kinase [Ktedonobacteraceae bacterium]